MVVGGQRHDPAALPQGKTRYQLYRGLGGPQGRSGRVRKMSSPPPGFDARTVQPVASRYTDWAIPARVFISMNCNNGVYVQWAQRSFTTCGALARLVRLSHRYLWHLVASLSPRTLLSGPVTTGMNTAAPVRVFGSVLRVSPVSWHSTKSLCAILIHPSSTVIRCISRVTQKKIK